MEYREMQEVHHKIQQSIARITEAIEYARLEYKQAIQIAGHLDLISDESMRLVKQEKL